MQFRGILLTVKSALLTAGMAAFSIAAYFGFRCPAPGCPCCKIVGK